MKAFLSSIKGKIIAGIAGGVVVVTGVVIAVVLLTSGHRSIAVEEANGQTIILNEKTGTKDAYEGMHLLSGDDVTVQKEANMTMLLDADKYVFAESGTHFWVKATGKSGKNSLTKIYLDKGAVLNRLDSDLAEDEAYEVETPNATMAVRGTIFRVEVYVDANGETFTRIDVLEGEVKVTLKMEDGTIKDESAVLTAGQSALVRSNPNLSEFVIGDGADEIPYEEFDKAMARFIVETIDTSRPICIERDLFIHYTELYLYYSELEVHNEKENIAREATCAEEGLIEVYCSVCEEVVREESIEKLAHTEGDWKVTRETTCKEAGEESLLCSVCNGVIEAKEIEKLEHTFERKNEDVEDGCVIHRTIQNVCSVCGEVEIVRTTDTENHTYGDWETTVECTCEKEGKEQQVCSVCGNIIEQIIEATGHSFGGWTTVTAANCGTGATGTQTRMCSNCSKVETSVIQPTHAWSAWNVIQMPTCLAEGLQSRNCTVCQAYDESTMPITGHVWVAMPDTHIFSTDMLAAQAGTQTMQVPQMCNDCGTQGTIVTHTVTLTAVNDPQGGVYYNCVCECGMTGELWP